MWMVPDEPYFTDERFRRLYPDRYQGPLFDWPPYGRQSYPPEVAEHLRLLNAALVSMCDHYLGRFLDRMDALDLWKDTLLIVSAALRLSALDHPGGGRQVPGLRRPGTRFCPCPVRRFRTPPPSRFGSNLDILSGFYYSFTMKATLTAGPCGSVTLPDRKRFPIALHRNIDPQQPGLVSARGRRIRLHLRVRGVGA